MKKGLEILESRKWDDKISFTSLEESLKINMPPLLRLFGGGVGIGTKSPNIDKVILLRKESDTEKELIAENVFELIRGIEEFNAWDVDLSKLYKSYHEEHWNKQ